MKIFPVFMTVFLILSSCAYSSDITRIDKNLSTEGDAYFAAMQKTGEFDYLLFLIEYGNWEAINFSAKLLSYSDASSAEAIKMSLGRALNKNTAAVLGMISKDIRAEEICTIPFIEAPRDIEEIHIKQAIKNLESFSTTNREIRKMRDKCLNLLEEIHY